MQTNVTVKGQVTIPKSVRDRAGIKPGSRVEVTVSDAGEVIVRPVDRSDPDWQTRRGAEIDRLLDKVAGSVDLGMTTEEYMLTLRDPVFP